MGTVREAALKKLNRRVRVRKEPVYMPGYQKVPTRNISVTYTPLPPEPEPVPVEVDNWTKLKDKVSQWLK